MIFNFDNLLKNKKLIFIILLILIFCQLIYSFLFTAYDPRNDYWKTIKEMNFYKGYSFGSFDNSIFNKISPFLSNYHINSDCAGYLLLAYDFPQHYFRGHLTNLNRPLYPFIINLMFQPLRLFSNSYALVFFAGIALNLILFFLTVIIFYSLVEKFISSRVAFLSSFLLIFSPFTHAWLVQPETNIFGAFMVMLSIYLIYKYIKNPSFKKLIIFSLIIGILTLGKMLFVVSIFIILLALYFKRYKEGTIFFVVHLIPRLIWYLMVTQVLKIHYFSTEVTDFNMGIWIIQIFNWPWYETFKVFVSVLPNFISSVLYGFLVVPIIFAVIGFKEFSLKKKNFLCFSFVLSFLLFFFCMNYYIPRHAFLMFPLIYPLAVLGIDRVARYTKQYKGWYPTVFYFAIFIFLIIISNVNIFRVFPYDVTYPWNL